MSSPGVLAILVVSTALVAVIVRAMSERADAILLMLSGAASLFLAAFASSAVEVGGSGEMMGFEMSETTFNVGILHPVFIVATLTVMRGLSNS